MSRVTPAFLRRRRCPGLARLLQTMDQLAPFALADTAWDNVGLIYEAPRRCEGPLRVLLAIDLTEAIVEQAARQHCHVILAYHPPWFAGTKRMTQDPGSEARLVALCADAGISLVAPHSALDNVRPGMNDHVLAALFPGQPDVCPIVPATQPGFEGCGSGRTIRLSEPVSLQTVLDRTCAHVGSPVVRFAGPSRDLQTARFRHIGVCVGSGASLLRAHHQRVLDDAVEPLDLFLTGEMSHHDILRAVHELGCTVVLTEHTRLERAFLYDEYRRRLSEALGQDAVVLAPAGDTDPVCYYAGGQPVFPTL